MAIERKYVSEPLEGFQSVYRGLKNGVRNTSQYLVLTAVIAAGCAGTPAKETVGLTGFEDPAQMARGLREVAKSQVYANRNRARLGEALTEYRAREEAKRTGVEFTGLTDVELDAANSLSIQDLVTGLRALGQEAVEGYTPATPTPAPVPAPVVTPPVVPSPAPVPTPTPPGPGGP